MSKESSSSDICMKKESLQEIVDAINNFDSKMSYEEWQNKFPKLYEMISLESNDVKSLAKLHQILQLRTAEYLLEKIK